MTDHVREYHPEEKESQTKNSTLKEICIQTEQSLTWTPKLMTLINKKPMYLESMNASTVKLKSKLDHSLSTTELTAM